MGCCESDEGKGNLSLKTGKSPKRSAKPPVSGSAPDERYGSAIDLSEDNIFYYASEEARSKYKSIGPYEPEGYNDPSSDLIESDLIEENG